MRQARNSSGLLNSSPSAPARRGLVPNFSGRTVSGTESFSTIRRNYEQEKDDLDQKIRFLDLLLEGERKSSVLMRQPQLREEVERYQAAKEEVRKAVTLLSPQSGGSDVASYHKKIPGVPIGLQTSMEYSECDDDELMRSGSMRLRHQEYVGAVRRMGRYFENYQRSMTVLKTAKANIMLPGEPFPD